MVNVHQAIEQFREKSIKVKLGYIIVRSKA